MFRITNVTIENFRSIHHLQLELGETTVLIGSNNTGKTAIIDAIRTVLTRRWGQRGTGFTEYDVRLEDDSADPKTAPAISIEIHLEENDGGEWSESIIQDLDDIIMLDATTGKNFISLRGSCRWNDVEATFQPSWEFLNSAREPLIGHSARRTNLDRFWKYIPFFYLSALRDVSDEFSSRSQFWRRLLKAMEIPPHLEGRVQQVLDRLNRRLLHADPRLDGIANTLSEAVRVAARDRDGSADLRLVPLKPWDLLSKADIVVRTEMGWPFLPLQSQGQGIQSLSMLFLFQAFVEHLLADIYEVESSPFLALEEPEAHLHPQAARALWSRVENLPGQKLVTTHSPYLVQHVPFRDIRIVKLSEGGTSVSWLPSSFSERIPLADGLSGVVARYSTLMAYEPVSETLTISGRLERDEYRALLSCFGDHAESREIQHRLRALKNRSDLFISDDELRRLETFARRIRGEIFFARRWLIVEGQAEYLVVQALAEALNISLDDQGISVIDVANNGNAGLFVALAKALEIPCVVVVDGDQGGEDYLRDIKRRCLDDEFMRSNCFRHADGNLEQQLIADGLESELRVVARACGRHDADTIDISELGNWLDVNKTLYASELGAAIRQNPTLASRMPEMFRNALDRLRELT